MTDFQSSFAQLMQANASEDSDTPKSLFDFINSHKSTGKQTNDEEIKSLSDLTSRHLSLKEPDQTVSTYFFSHGGCVEDSKIASLADYPMFCKMGPCERLIQKAPVLDIKRCDENETLVNVIHDRLRNIEITGPRKIDLTAALLNSSDISTPLSSNANESLKRESFSYPLKECIIDISSLADEKMSYGNNHVTNFGYVISKEWNPLPMPQRYRKIGRKRPYSVAKSFKFDTPSPDDVILKSRNRKNTE